MDLEHQSSGSYGREVEFEVRSMGYRTSNNVQFFNQEQLLACSVSGSLHFLVDLYLGKVFFQ